MSGKSYTMREMKSIVEYLTEQRAYGEIKGRKMWIDYASSKLTTRTWQSLKETFLKRILPDITNPYYKLTVEQIASFQQGADLEAKINNKLEIQTVHDESSNDNQKKDPQSSNPNNTKGENDAGEDVQSAQVNQNRSSTDTVVIEPCYKSAEEVQKALESPTNENDKKNYASIPCSTKSIRDYITYSEPLTPMLQEVLHDFASEDEGDEPQMQIVEYPEPCIRNKTSSPIELFDTENNDGGTENNENTDNANNAKSNDKESTENKINENVLFESDLPEAIDKSDDVINIQDTEEVTENTANKDDVIHDVSNSAINSKPKNSDENNVNLSKSQSNSNSITDTLPNNQEALKDICKARENSLEKQGSGDTSVTVCQNDSRKRSKSQENEYMTPKKRKCTDKSLERKSPEKNTAVQLKETTSKLDSIKNKTEVKSYANSENEKKTNHNPVNPNSALDVITKKCESRQNPIENNESMCISDSSSDIQQLPENISIKTDEDEPSLTSVDKESPRTFRGDNRVSKITTQRNENPRYIKEVINEVVILKSHSDSSSDNVMVSPKKNKASHGAVHKMHRDRDLANVLGFSSGANRNRHKNVKRRSTHQRNMNTSSSNEWTSDTGTEYISPPRGRKNKQSRKYLKPKSARVLSLEEEGGLFVMYGKKIYPVVKDGKLVKNYVTYTPDNDSEDEESYWKLKYVQEKKKTDELTKLLKHNTKPKSVAVASEKARVPQAITCEESPITTVTEPPKEIEKEKSKISTVPEPPKDIVKEKNAEVEETFKEPQKKEQATETKTVKIQFMKNNETVQLEGHWSHIQPVLEQVVNILHKEPEPKERQPPEKESVEREIGNQQVERSARPTPVKRRKISRDSTPVSTVMLDDDIQEKIDKLEEEIYQQIQERAIAENSNEDTTTNTNVTTRKMGRPRLAAKNDNSVPETSKVTPALDPPGVDSSGTTVVTRRQARTPKKANVKEITEKVTNNQTRRTRNSSRNNAALEEDSSIKYKLPSPEVAEHASDNRNKSTKRTSMKQTSKRRYPIKTARIFSSPDNISVNSIDSSQGYQDSDGSNLSICLRKKRKMTLTVLNRGRSNQRAIKKKSQYVYEDMSSDSNISFVTAPLKSSSHQSSSLNTEVYRSESYQMLFSQRQNSVQHLEKIDERSLAIDKISCLNKNDDAASEQGEKSSLSVNENNSENAFNGEYSSNVTLPPSPVLSIVEKLTLSKNALDSTKDIDMPDDSAEEVKQTMLNDYMLLDVDMSVPLMEQESGLRKSCRKENESHYKLNLSEISDSLISKVCAVNITEPTLSESIHQKLKNLLLESAKKIAKQINENNDKEKVNKMEITEIEKQQKTMKKKRCSTPRKRQNKQNCKVGNIEAHIEEEHIVSCAIEKSDAPPVLIVTDAIEVNNNVATDVSNQRRKSDRLRKKKDVIKVKILKPKTKSKEYSSDDIVQKETKTSLQADSGINDTESGIFLRGFEDSVELIHNHSDTCLQAHECIGDSVEIIDDNAMSVLTVNSNSVPISTLKCSSLTDPNEDNLLDICCENAQDGTNLYTATDISQHISKEQSCIFKSPANNISPVNSLLTDDLSDENSPRDNKVQKRISKWYLLSEDEASNTNNFDIEAHMLNSNSGYGGANLQEIFPVTCAVPDLSTITEENTTKFIIERNTKSEFDSQKLSNV